MTIELTIDEKQQLKLLNGYFYYKFRGLLWALAFVSVSVLLLWIIPDSSTELPLLDTVSYFVARLGIAAVIFFALIAVFAFYNIRKNAKKDFQAHNIDGVLKSRISLTDENFVMENLNMGNLVSYHLTPDFKVRAFKKVLVLISPRKQDLVILPNTEEVRNLFQENGVTVITK